MQRVADIKELFLAVQFEFVQSFQSRLSPEAVELLTMDADDVAQIAVPVQDGAEDVVESESCTWSDTEIRRITMGFTWRRTARRSKAWRKLCQPSA